MEMTLSFLNDADGPPYGLPIMSGVRTPCMVYDRLHTTPHPYVSDINHLAYVLAKKQSKERKKVMKVKIVTFRCMMILM